MPFVRIDAIDLPPHRLEQLGDAVQVALMEAIGCPADDRFQILTSHGGRAGHGASTVRHGTYLDVPRDDGIVYIAITLRAGRTEQQKRLLYQRICELAGEQAGVQPHNVFVVLHENGPADWSLGYGAAQYLP